MAEDFWERLRLATRARVGLGRSGDAMRLGDVLDFLASHEPDLLAAAAALDVEPAELVSARKRL